MLFWIPVFWRYILANFCKIFLLSLSGFISVLFVTRIKEIARFAALSTSCLSLIKYIFYQIPFILPIALPVSCLIAAFVSCKKMSSFHEITAMRSCGISIKKICTPLLFFAFFLSLVNIIIISEIMPICRNKSKRMLFDQSSFNPIVLLQRKNLSRLKKTYVDMEIVSNNAAKNFLCIIPSHSNQRLNLIHAQYLKNKQNTLTGKNVTTISHIESAINSSYDHLIIENQSQMITQAEGLSQVIKTAHWSLNPSYMPMKILLAKMYMPSTKKKYTFYLLCSEITRRLSLSFCVFTFTLLGIAFGVHIHRTISTKKLLLLTSMALVILMSFALGKAFKNYAFLSLFLYIIPQTLVLFVTKHHLNKIEKGIDFS